MSDKTFSLSHIVSRNRATGLFSVPDCLEKITRCPAMKDLYFKFCVRCGELTVSDTPETAGLICSDCQDDVFTCECCHELAASGGNYGPYEDYQGGLICTSCSETRYVGCCNCDELHYRDDSWNGYCPSCAEERTICRGCEDIIRRNDAYGNSRNGYYCLDCHENGEDEKMNIAQNPPVTKETSEKLEAVLVRPIPTRKNTCQLTGNPADMNISQIIKMVGDTSAKLYIYGLVDRPDYGFTLTSDIATIGKKHISSIFGESVPVSLHNKGERRLGIAYCFRQDKEKCMELIKAILAELPVAHFARPDIPTTNYKDEIFPLISVWDGQGSWDSTEWVEWDSLTYDWHTASTWDEVERPYLWFSPSEHVEAVSPPSEWGTYVAQINTNTYTQAYGGTATTNI